MATSKSTKNTAKNTSAKSAAARSTSSRAAGDDDTGVAMARLLGEAAAQDTGAPARRILLVDLGQREHEVREELRARRQVLRTIRDTADTSGGLSAKQQKELAEIEATLASDIVADPFYRRVIEAYTLKGWDQLVRENDYLHEYGLVGSQRMRNLGDGGPDSTELYRQVEAILKKAEAAGETVDRQAVLRALGLQRRIANVLQVKEREIGAICGLLQLEGMTDAGHRGFVRKVSEAQGEYRQHHALFEAALTELSHRYPVSLGSQIASGLIDRAILGSDAPGGSPQERAAMGDDEQAKFSPGAGDRVFALSMRNVAAVVRKLAADGVSANDPWLSSRIENAYEMQSGVTGGAAPSSMEIALPDLEDATDGEIQHENLKAAQGIYFAYMLEEARMPQVVEKIVDLFRSGLLPLSYGKVGDYLYGYYKKSSERITEGERRDLYMRALGAPGGDPALNQPNREFNELWLRFVSAVSSFGRQLSVDRMFRSHVPLSVSQEQVRKAGRDLAASLSRSCYGIAYQFSSELKSLIIEYRDLLSDPEIRNAFGARDMWQVMDQVNINYLGGARNSHRYRTQAKAGATVIAWLMKNHLRLNNRYGDVIAVNALTNPQLRGSDRPMEDPTDWDLLQACEQWLAVGGVQDARVEEYAQPIESPTITSKPIEMPQIARDVLESAGIGLPGF